MKIISFILFFTFNFISAYSETNIIFYLESTYKNNPKLNAERENLKAIKENINISRAEFLPNISLSGSVDNTQSTNKTNSLGNKTADSSLKKETKTVSVDQKLFQGFTGYNSFKKSKLEFDQANSKLKNVEQEIIFDAASVYLDLIYKEKNKVFNLANVDLFERQVESDSIRMQKGEISLTDLAQSESSLAGARANLISAETELLSTKTNFQKITRVEAPTSTEKSFNMNINLPNSLSEALKISQENNPRLQIAKLDHLISKKNVNIEIAKFSPSASINYSKSENKDYSSTTDEIDQEMIKATMSWPIIKGGKNYSSIKKSKFKEKQSSLILQDAINETKTSTTNAWSLYQSSKSVLKATEAQLKAAEIANEGITLEYDSGNQRTTLEVIQSRSLLLNARISHAKAERDFVISKFKLLASIGKLSLDSISKI